MEPTEFFKKPIIGKLRTRMIDKLSLEGVSSSIKEEKDYDIIDVVINGEDKMFVTNTWEDEKAKIVLAIHNNFVKETTL